jgi:hypothetical protein
VSQDKEIKHSFGARLMSYSASLVKKPRDINELLQGGSGRLRSLAQLRQARTTTLAHVRASLPAELAKRVSTAGIEAGRLTVGVSTAAWASRVRYAADELRQKVAKAMGVEIKSVRIRVVQASAPPP